MQKPYQLSNQSPDGNDSVFVRVSFIHVLREFLGRNPNTVRQFLDRKARICQLCKVMSVAPEMVESWNAGQEVPNNHTQLAIVRFVFNELGFDCS